ncbi:MAG: acyltransferase [Bacteroidia bacterium]|nr:acyltransferase [Bacteroidia bacterium]
MRIEQLTFTRFVAALSIVVFHYGKNIAPFNHLSISFLFTQANVGVSYFFILSGFVMIIAYGNQLVINTLEYYKNRIARIYPVYFLAIVLVFTFKLFGKSVINVVDLALNIFSLQAWIPGKALSFNGVGWSLSVEFLFYALFPFLFNYIYSKKYSFKWLSSVILLVFVVTQLVLHWFLSSVYYHGFPSPGHDFIYYFPLMHLNEFLIGNAVGLLFIKQLKHKTGSYDIPIISLVVLIGIVLKYPIGLEFHNGLLAILFVPLIVFVALNNGLLTRIMKLKWFVYLGEISFGVYILQRPVFNYSNFLFGKLGVQNPTFLFYVAIVVLVIVAGLSYSFIETPLRYYIKTYRSKAS